MYFCDQQNAHMYELTHIYIQNSVSIHIQNGCMFVGKEQHGTVSWMVYILANQRTGCIQAG